MDVVFPVLHGTFGEDGTVQGLLELAGLPYVGAGVLASAVGMDKDVQKRLFEQAGLPIVPYRRVPPLGMGARARRRVEADQEKVALSGVREAGDARVVRGHDAREGRAANLPAAMDLAAEFALKIMVERAVTAREIEVSVLGNDDVRASIPGEIVPHREFYDYTAKYLEQGTRLVIPAQLTKKQVKHVSGVRRARVPRDRRHGHGALRLFPRENAPSKIFVNELNTIPGFTSISMYPKMWEASGLPYPKLIDRLIELALELPPRKERARNIRSSCPRDAGGALES